MAPETLAGTEHHPHARAILTPALPPSGSPNHAYLFHGPAGSGKRDVARAFAAALLSDGAPDPKGAADRVLNGTHPDLTWVVPTGAADMRVEDVEEPVIMAATRTPFEARRRVFVLERADTLNDSAANRMLKTLEEPAAFAHLILLTDRPGDVLPTIASRCQGVRFDAQPPAALADRLSLRHGIAPPTALACARLALGDGEQALALALGTGPALRQGAEKLARAAIRDELTDKPWAPLLAEARRAAEEATALVEGTTSEELEFTSRRDRKRTEREGADRGKRAGRRAGTRALDLGLKLTGLWLRDLACLLDGTPEVVLNVDRLEALDDDAAFRQLDPGALRAAMEAVDDTRSRLVINVTEELALEALAYTLEATLA